MFRRKSISPEDIRAENRAILSEQGIPVNTHLPLIDAGDETSLRSSQSIARRLIIAYAITGLGKDRDVDPQKLYAWLCENDLCEELSQREVSYFLTPLTSQDIVQLSWRQERLMTYAWVLALIEALPLPNHEADISGLFPLIPPVISQDEFIRSARRIDANRIYLILDRYYCYHWALRHPEKWNGKPTHCISIVQERRLALEWTIGMEKAPDDISLDT